MNKPITENILIDDYPLLVVMLRDEWQQHLFCEKLVQLAKKPDSDNIEEYHLILQSIKVLAEFSRKVLKEEMHQIHLQVESLLAYQNEQAKEAEQVVQC